ncbi:MAG: hypothetical protein Q8N76_01655 [Candidatus Omnitrophota bacterium]|nr:hypothetical protein [Candidatus Omnitrophota bacterium]
MPEKDVEKPAEVSKEPEKFIEAQKKESEKPIESKGPITPATGKFTDEIIEEVSRISIEELDKPGGWKKLLIAMYKEKAYENRTLQDKINTLNTANSDLSKKLGVSQERLRQISGVGVAMGFLNIIAGGMIAFMTSLPDSTTRTILFLLAISIFIVCIWYSFWNGGKQKNIE